MDKQTVQSDIESAFSAMEAKFSSSSEAGVLDLARVYGGYERAIAEAERYVGIVNATNAQRESIVSNGAGPAIGQ